MGNVVLCHQSLKRAICIFSWHLLWYNWSDSCNCHCLGNQYFNLSVQLKSGVRLIQAQGHLAPNGANQIRLCHFNCALIDGGSLDDYLLTTKAWLEENPKEGKHPPDPLLRIPMGAVVTFLFVSTNPSLRNWAETYRRTGFDRLSYAPPASKRANMSISDWPTIEEMIDSGKRAVTFLSSRANEQYVPYLLNEWSYLFETDFVNDKPSDFSCTPSRPPPPFEGAPIPENRLTFVNHFLYASFFGWRYPNISYIEHTNGAGFKVGQLGEHAVRCRGVYGRRPNFLLVDFWNEGDVWGVEGGINKS